MHKRASGLAQDAKRRTYQEIVSRTLSCSSDRENATRSRCQRRAIRTTSLQAYQPEPNSAASHTTRSIPFTRGAFLRSFAMIVEHAASMQNPSDSDATMSNPMGRRVIAYPGFIVSFWNNDRFVDCYVEEVCWLWFCIRPYDIWRGETKQQPVILFLTYVLLARVLFCVSLRLFSSVRAQLLECHDHALWGQSGAKNCTWEVKSRWNMGSHNARPGRTYDFNGFQIA